MKKMGLIFSGSLRSFSDPPPPPPENPPPPLPRRVAAHFVGIDM